MSDAPPCSEPPEVPAPGSDSSGTPGQRRAVLISEVQLLLAEKRTSLSVVRTGIAVAALPLSIIGLLIATSKMYDPRAVGHLLVPLLAVCAGLFLLGVYLLGRGVLRIRHQDRQIASIRALDGELSALLD